MSFSVPGNSFCEAESQQVSLKQSACTVPNLVWCLERTTEPRAMQFKFTVHSPQRPVAQCLDSEISSVREQITVTHIVCMQHSEELRIGDELHSWRLQQQGDFLRIHRRKGTFPPNLWTKKKQQTLTNVVASTVYYFTFNEWLQK